MSHILHRASHTYSLSGLGTVTFSHVYNTKSQMSDFIQFKSQLTDYPQKRSVPANVCIARY